MTQITGIDLGTTNSAAAILNELGKPEIVANTDGERITPSLLFFDEQGVEIGHAAKDRAKSILPEEGKRYVMEIKRKMPDLDHRVSILGKEYSPTQLSSLILKKVASGVLKHKGGHGPVAISVPAYFHDAERIATIEAGKLAGLDVVSIVDEPVAAALAHSVSNQLDGTYLVFDLGGGTFDVAVLSGKGNGIEVLATAGNRELGGSDFDNAIFSTWRELYRHETGQELCMDENGNQEALHIKYLDQAQSTKHALSKRDKHSVRLQNEAGGKPVKCTITRKEFEEKISHKLALAEMLMEQAISEADMKDSDISEVLLVGGSTRVPKVVELVHQHFGKVPTTNFNPDEVVALGAAVHAGYSTLSKRPDFDLPESVRAEMETRTIVHVVNHSYGTTAVNPATKKLRNNIIIKKNTPLPARNSEVFSTVADNQTNLNCDVTEGEETDPDFMPPPVYEANLKLPPGRPAGQEIHVEFMCDTNHILHCQFKDVESGAIQKVRLDLTKGTGKGNDGGDKPPDDLKIL